MPCDTITTQSIKLANAMPDLIEKALRELGWQIKATGKNKINARKSYDYLVWEAGKGLTISGNNNEKHLAEISQAYSKQAVTWAAQRAGWQVANQTKNTLNIVRR